MCIKMSYIKINSVKFIQDDLCGAADRLNYSQCNIKCPNPISKFLTQTQIRLQMSEVVSGRVRLGREATWNKVQIRSDFVLFKGLLNWARIQKFANLMQHEMELTFSYPIPNHVMCMTTHANYGSSWVGLRHRNQGKLVKPKIAFLFNRCEIQN